MPPGGISSTFARALRRAAGCALALLSLPLAAADERRSYDLPAGEATTTLKQFAEQARREIIFPAEGVAGVRTNAVRGKLTEHEALSLLLANTGLVSVRDAASGTLLVKPAAPRRPHPPPKASERSPPDPDPMKKSPRPWRALAALLFTTAADAQPAAPAPVARDDAPVVTMSPFEVSTSQDKGFVASSSLAGGRLGSDLKDTPVAYSVLTRDLIDALELTDFAELSKWAPNSTSLTENGFIEAMGTSVFAGSRGVSSSNPQRNFFPYALNFDSYNIERLDMARGPNAALFGTSGLTSGPNATSTSGSGGTANSVTKRATTARQFTEVRLSYGSWENFRFTLDHNQPLGETVAVRLNTLYADRKGWRWTDFENRKGATLALTWKPLKHTEIRAEAETAERAKAVIATNMDDHFSGWDGKTTFSAPIAAAIPSAGIDLGGTLEANPTGLRAARFPVYTPSNGEGLLMNYAGWAQTVPGRLAANTPAGGVIVPGASPNLVNTPLGLYVLGLPDNYYDLFLNNSRAFLPSRKFGSNWDTPNYALKNQNFTLSVTQQIGNNLFIEAAANYGRERLFNELSTSRGVTYYKIDVNSRLPNGAVNPNFLEPYSEGVSSTYLPVHETFNTRISVGYVLERTRFGDFRFNFLAGTSSDRDEKNSYLYQLDLHPDRRQLLQGQPFFAPIAYRFYFNTDQGRSIPKPQSWTFIDPVAGTTQTVNPITLRDYRSPLFNSRSQLDYDYAQAALSAKFFKGRLNVLSALRRDGFKTERQTQAFQLDNPADWDGATFTARPAPPADWAELTYRRRDANGVPFGDPVAANVRPRVNGARDARYASDRFRDDYSPPGAEDAVVTFTAGTVGHLTNNISVFANYAQSYIPPSIGVYDVDGEVFDRQPSQGWDYGLRFNWRRGDIVANILRYEGREKERPLTSAFQTDIENITLAPPLGVTAPGAINARGLISPPQGYSDTTQTESSGWEIEVTANLTDNWRLTVNGALPEVYESGAYPQTIAWLAENDAALRGIITDAGGQIDANNVAAARPGVTPVASGNTAINAWNSIQNRFLTLSGSDKQKLNRLTESTANLYTDYGFTRGSLKGFRIGAGVNYRGRTVIGNRGAQTMRNPSNPAAAIDDPNVGPLDPVYLDPYMTATLTFAYSRKLSDKVHLRLNLKVDNVFDFDEPLYFNTVSRPVGGDLLNPAREPVGNRYTWLTPRNYTLTATFRF